MISTEELSAGCNLLLKVQPPADRSRAQMKMVLTHRARRGKNAEAFLNYKVMPGR